MNTTLTEHTIKFLNTTTGREKLMRYLQFFSRFVLTRTTSSKETTTRITNLMNTIGLTRKVMLTGKQLEFLRFAIKSLQNERDSVVGGATFCKGVLLAMWVTLDTCQWLHMAQVRTFTNINDITKRANQIWLLSILFSLTASAYKLKNNADALHLETQVKELAKSKEIVTAAKEKLVKLHEERQKLYIATAMDSFDLLLPIAFLDMVKIDSGAVGLIGALTSFLGGYAFWKSI
ncbi:Peroxisomal membrane protein PMP27 [Podochytrium sp. JEL0797]|nr:Peroxisomal membrane protein PMP27 [Podochytrium sp. JEL0797]